MKDCIEVRKARVNNLKDIDLQIPRGKFVVITGVSGSGKSSLAFDTLYAEGQRRYVESLSAYARQFLGRMHKPECDYINGLPPAIAIEQKVSSRNPRSTVGTSTEIYDYLRLLYARVGRTISPVSGEEVKRDTVDDIVSETLKRPVGTRFTVLAPLVVQNGRSLKEQLVIYLQQGFSRVENSSGEIIEIEEVIKSCNEKADLRLLVSRNVVDDTKNARQVLANSLETALFEGHGECFLRFYPDGELKSYSTHFERDGIEFQTPSDQLFSFNSPVGACPECEGFGRIIGIDESLVIPDSSLSVYDGAVICWRGEKMGQWKTEFIRRASALDFPIFEPYYNLTQEQKDILWHGHPALKTEWGDTVCIDSFFEMLRQNQYKIQYRVMLARYRGKTVCPKCHGDRLRPEALYVKVGDKNIAELCRMQVKDLTQWFEGLGKVLTENERQIAARLLTEIRSRLHFLMEVGLGYLTLSRLSNTLSGGESQRINLATSLGSALVGSLYILDEPSIGLHPRDTEQLISVLKQLRDLGNTVIVVEHDAEFIRQADYVIEIGPNAGIHGGEVVYAGKPRKKDVQPAKLPAISTRPWNRYVEVKGARHNNLKGIDVKFPLNVMTCVTGVSGSGKSTLVRDILYCAMKRHFDEACDRPGEFKCLSGDLDAVKAIEFVDQNPIGKSTRSNPVTYVKAFDEIRHLMAEQPLAQQLGMTAAFFSFNAEGGRCEECKGEGVVKVEMQFMADLVLECEACHGKRFKNDVLEVKFHGKNINDMLDFTVDEAIDFFQKHKQKRIVNKLLPLQKVGLGYLKLGQSSATLSGGENQRVKLAYYLSLEARESRPTIFIFDEPTTGLHSRDIEKLLVAFNGLIERGHTLIVIEHNLDVISRADHLIDLGPEGGEEGGSLVAAGTVNEVMKSGGHTGEWLKKMDA